MPTDLQKKDELSRELRMLELSLRFVKDSGVDHSHMGIRILNERSNEIKKALED